MKKTLICAVVAMILVVSGVANGTVIIVDPDAFPAGTVLNNSYPGVTLSAVGNYSGADGNVYALTHSLASTGTKVFGSSWSLSSGPFGEWGFDTSYQPHLRVDFDSLVMSVMIDAIGNNTEDYGRLEAYSSTSVLLDVFETGLLQTGDVETMSISRISADIAYILVAGKDPGPAPHHTIHLDNLNYVISEPTTPPECNNAVPNVAEIWPPRHEWVDIEILDVNDPDGDPVSITITGITQDEPVAGHGSGKTSPDGMGVGTSVAHVRAERSGQSGNGRVYEISFEADDGTGNTCNGSVKVCVPHDQGRGHECVDDGQLYDSIATEMFSADLNGDGIINQLDFNILANYWLVSYELED